MARLALSLLGPFEVTLDATAVTASISTKGRALLAYLAVESGRPHRRDMLAGLLWPDYPERSARTNLRNTLSDLRAATEMRRRPCSSRHGKQSSSTPRAIPRWAPGRHSRQAQDGLSGST